MFLCVITFFSWTIQLKTSKVGTIPFQVQNESLRQLFFAIAVWQTDWLLIIFSALHFKPWVQEGYLFKKCYGYAYKILYEQAH